LKLENSGLLVIKRDGCQVLFDGQLIMQAVQRAAAAVNVDSAR
jgi:anaerobic ribonucleoside-triphosphate reductase